MTNDDWIVHTRVGDQERHFARETLPVTIGAESNADVRLQDVTGSVQIGELDGAFFLQPGRDIRPCNAKRLGNFIRGQRMVGKMQQSMDLRHRTVCAPFGAHLPPVEDEILHRRRKLHLIHQFLSRLK